MLTDLPARFDGEEPHVDSGSRCLAHHYGEESCIYCSRCRAYIRPEEMEKRCPGVPTPADDGA